MNKLKKLNKGKSRDSQPAPVGQEATPNVVDPAPAAGPSSSAPPSSGKGALVPPSPDTPTVEEAPPPYTQFDIKTNDLSSSATVDPEDGTIQLRVDATKLLAKVSPQAEAEVVQEFAVDTTDPDQVPPLEIVIFIVGSRGDVQPFLPLGLTLQRQGHRVRIATHGVFDSFVRDTGLEFADIGGNPAQLMEYMVANPGLLPGVKAMRKGEVGLKRKMIKEILEGCWKACHEPDAVSGRAFAADLIIANPPSFAHIHCAEVLNIPVHVVFTMPWYSTQSFSHPLVKLSSSNTEPSVTNYMSYSMVDMLTWSGLGDIINAFRRKTLGLDALTARTGPLILERMRIPHTFCWSPSLIPKPKDWANHIDVTGFNFIELGQNYTPPDNLKEFLDAGEAPVFIGFGSVPVTDPAKMTQTILDAVTRSGVRCLLSVGWGKLGEGIEIPSNVFLLAPCPHDWLFDHVKAVVHHGGAGTTAIGLLKGKATLVVPFFGDQPFWGRMIEESGAGLMIPNKTLDVDNLSEALTRLVSPAMQEAAQALGAKMHEEDGANDSAKSVTRHLPLLNMRCDLDPTKVAVWYSPDHYLKLSAFAAEILSEEKKLSIDHLRLHKAKTYLTRGRINDPLSGVAFVTGKLLYDFNYGLGEMFVHPLAGLTRHVGAIPVAMGNYVGVISEGLHNTPALYGSTVRSVGEVTSFNTGMKAAGKGFLWDVADSLTGLVTTPMHEGRKGPLGLAKGIGKSWLDFLIKPAAGGLKLVDLPIRGWIRSMKKKYSAAAIPEALRMATRIHEGTLAVTNSSPAERAAVLAAWEKASLWEEKRARKKAAEKEYLWWQTAFQTDEWRRGEGQAEGEEMAQAIKRADQAQEELGFGQEWDDEESGEGSVRSGTVSSVASGSASRTPSRKS